MRQTFTADLDNQQILQFMAFHASSTPATMSLRPWRHKIVAINDKRLGRKPRPIILQIFYGNGERSRIRLGFSIPLSKWDAKNQRVKGSDQLAATLNSYIEAALVKVFEIFQFHTLHNEPLSKKIFEAKYHSKPNQDDFIEFALTYLKKQLANKEITKGSYKKDLCSIKRLQSFQKNISFNEIDSDFVKAYKSWLLNSCASNTVTLRLFVLKKVVNRARKENLIRINPFEGVKMRYENGERQPLLPEHVAQLLQLYQNADLDKSIKDVLQYFLFSCFTGIRYSDIHRINSSMLVNGVLIFQPQKTRDKFVRIPYPRVVDRLINKQGPIFNNVQTNQATNRTLKLIQSILKLDFKLSYHNSRHTFACLYLFFRKDTGGMALVDLKRILGHADVKTTMIYAHVVEAWLAEGISNFDEYFKEYL